jgi:hypothetical protein
MQVDDNWVDVKDIAGNAITFSAAGMFNFELPACGIRMNGTVTDATVKVIGV